MRRILPVSIVLGLVWNLIVVGIMGGGARGALQPAWLLAGAVAGAVAGAFTLWSRRRSGGRERLVDGIATYYLAMVVYWAVFVVFERARLCLRAGRWTDFDLHDHLALIGAFLTYGTIWYGLVLIPLCLLTRRLVWWIYSISTRNERLA